MTIRIPALLLLATLLMGLAAPGPAAASGKAPVAINGVQLSYPQLRALEQQLGTRIAPGSYLTDARGCWINLSSGASGCLGQGGDVHSRYGSGSRDGAGNWNHYSRAAGGAVGGTSDGCIYTSFGWSNC